ncbi:YfhD family protein [Peribacillus alkalitolerans]|uniref:YfhD family protein n=1 Tax=Peribacillus alkalitolerans TaxID=1550385 RepID=UPI0013CF58E4
MSTVEKNKTFKTHAAENFKSDGIDVEYSAELADQDDLEAQARSKAADERARRRK